MHDLDIIKINECLVAKILLTNVTKTNEHSNVATFVRTLVCICVYTFLRVRPAVCNYSLPLYHMVGNFCGVQIFLDFMCSAYPRKIIEF